MSTRDLLACAAIGVVAGLLMLPVVYLQLGAAFTVPVVYTMCVGVFVLAPVTAQAVVRAPWAAFVGALVAALASSPASPRGVLGVVPMALIGLVYEGFAAGGRYRRWPAWRWYAASLVVAAFSTVTFTAYYDLPAFGPVMGTASIIAVPLSYLLVTFLALRIAARLGRAGIGTGPDPEGAVGYVEGPARPGREPR